MMSDRSKTKQYVFGAALASVALGGVPSLLHKAKAASATNADFTFENVNQTFFPSSGTGTATFSGGTSTFTNYAGYSSHASVGPLIAESGSGTAYGVHASTKTVWSSPAGNGSSQSFSANVWSQNDYYEFDVPTTSIQNIIVSFDQVSSSTGPRDFELLAIDGIGSATYTIGSYVLPSGQSFSAGASNTTLHYAFSLTSNSAGTVFDNNSSVAFRLVNYDTAGVTGSIGTAGTDRVDNFMVAGDQIIGVPEPSTLALASIGISGLLMRHKARKPGR
jgi:hypothetical protein